MSHYKLFQKYSITKCWAPLQNWKVSMSLVWMIITPSEEMSKGSSTYTWYNKICNRQTRFFCYIKFPICLLCYLFCLTEVAQLYYTNFLTRILGGNNQLFYWRIFFLLLHVFVKREKNLWAALLSTQHYGKQTKSLLFPEYRKQILFSVHQNPKEASSCEIRELDEFWKKSTN